VVQPMNELLPHFRKNFLSGAFHRSFGADVPVHSQSHGEQQRRKDGEARTAQAWSNWIW
jgi:hypothetical protein